MTEFKRGDVVCVKLPGSPAMWVTSTKHDYVQCFWFSANGEVLSTGFSPESLEHVARSDRRPDPAAHSLRQW